MVCSLVTRWALLLLLAACLHQTYAACVVSMNGGLPDPQPLILTPGGTPGFKLPSRGEELTFTSGERVRLVCAGAGNSFAHLSSDVSDITVSCDSGASFTHGGDRRNFELFSCSQAPLATTRRSQSLCIINNNNNKSNILEIGFKVSDSVFLKVIDVCFDPRRLNNVWSISRVLSIVKWGESDFNPADAQFTSTDLFSGLEPDKLYSKRTQRSSIGRIIGNVQANHYINTTHFLTRGLLSDSANFVYKSQKMAALSFANAAPQWQNLRTGTWAVVESRIREYASVRGVDLVVYSGTHGVATLPDVSKIPQDRELYLSVSGRTKRVPVPALFWKVVYDPISKKGIALVAVNNPHKTRSDLEADPRRYDVCETKRYVSSWHLCASSNQQAGFGYCCEVDDFRRFVKTLPQFEVTDILT